jgi:hypothetical protein
MLVDDKGADSPVKFTYETFIRNQIYDPTLSLLFRRNIKENVIIKCVIIEGSKSIFDNGGDIKLKCLNSEELDLSYSVLFKGVLSKSLQAYPEKAISNFKTIDFQLTCNKKEIIYEENTFYYGEFIIDPELKEILIDQ